MKYALFVIFEKAAKFEIVDCCNYKHKIMSIKYLMDCSPGELIFDCEKSFHSLFSTALYAILIP